MEASVWDLDGNVQYHHLEHGICVTSKKTQTTFQMTYPTLKNAQPVYFLLLKLIDTSRKTLSRNFYWLHLRGENYRLLESLRAKKAPVHIEVKSSLTGRDWRLKVLVENQLTGLCNTDICKEVECCYKKDKDISSCIWSRICPCLTSKEVSKLFPDEDKQNGGKKPKSFPIAFWLQLSVIYRGDDDQEIRILPVNYSENYFSLTPGEKMEIDVSFENPEKASSNPILVLSGWNINQRNIILSFP